MDETCSLACHVSPFTVLHFARLVALDKLLEAVHQDLVKGIILSMTGNDGPQDLTDSSSFIVKMATAKRLNHYPHGSVSVVSAMLPAILVYKADEPLIRGLPAAGGHIDSSR